MEHTEIIVKVIAVIIEIAGLFLLAREVYRGHQTEELSKGLEFVRQMQFLYAKQDYEGCYIASRLDQGDKPEDARKWITTLGLTAVQQAVLK